VPIVGAPDIERSLGAAHATLALVMFVVPGVFALVVEPLLFLLADRYPRRWFIRGGVGAMALGSFGAAVAPGPVTLSLAFCLMWCATGVATGLAQATLVDASPDARGRTLARWTLWSLGGDLMAPALLAGLAIVGGTWRVAFVIVGGLLALTCIQLLVTPLDDVRGDHEDEEDSATKRGLFATLRDVMTDKLLLAWVFGCALCDLLDEILVVFASLHLRAELGASAVWQSAVVGAFMVGGAIGLVALDRLLRVRTERWLLVAACVATIVSFVAWLAAPSLVLSLVLAVPVGIASTPLYPLAAAQAYAARPEQSGAVLAASQLFMPMGLALPWLIGLVADAAGTYVALALLVAQPAGLIALTWRTARRA
jgi:MFS family permease